MGYNKPITARIQHSTNKGMKVQEPLLDIGSAAKQVDTSADASLISGAADVGAASQPVDVTKAVSEGMDKVKVSQPKKEKEASEEEEAPGSPAPFNPALRKAKAQGKLSPEFAAVVKKKKGY